MTKEQLGSLIIASEDSLYRVAKTLLYSDADCADAIQESIVKAFSNVHTLRVVPYLYLNLSIYGGEEEFTKQALEQGYVDIRQ